MKRLTTAAASFAIGAALIAGAPAPKPGIYDFNLPDIDGKMISFSTFKNKVLLIVNIADQSNFTPQLGQLETIYQQYKDQGLLVLAFPSNDFGAEEPENEHQIKTFCQTNYHVSYLLFSKVFVRGDDVTPLFQFLSSEANTKLKGPVHWNFTKFLLDRKGELVNRFEPPVPPDDPKVMVAIENALAGKKPEPPAKQDEADHSDPSR